MKEDTIATYLSFPICLNAAAVPLSLWFCGFASIGYSVMLLGCGFYIRKAQIKCLMGCYIVLAGLQAVHLLLSMSWVLGSLIYWIILTILQGGISYFYYQVLKGEYELPSGEAVPKELQGVDAKVE